MPLYADRHYGALLLKTILGAMMLAGCAIFADNKKTITAETLLRTTASWDQVPYKNYPQGQPELTIVKYTLPPHTTMAWHTHPMPNAGYVVSGELLVERKEDGKQIRIAAGQPLAEMVDTLHRGVTGDSSVEIIVFYAGTPGMPLVNIGGVASSNGH